MIIHDPRSEEALLRLAAGVCGKKGFEKPDRRWWTGLPSRVFVFLTPLAIAFFFMGGLESQSTPAAIRQMVGSVLMMLLIRAGMILLGTVSQKCGLFTTLANLPVSGRIALAYVRSRFIRKFWLPALSASLVIAWGMKSFSYEVGFLPHAALMCGITFATMVICESRWLTGLRLVKIWYAAGSLVIAYLLYLHFSGGIRTNTPPAIAEWMDRLLWIFPPAWVFPGKAESGGLILAGAWMLRGLWSWIRWPSTACPAYDKPLDFHTIFGNPGKQEIPSVSHPEESIVFEPPMTPASHGWVNRLVLRSIPPEELAAAGAILDSGAHWTKRTNLALLLAPFWLIAAWLGQDLIPENANGEFIRIAQWIIPITYAALAVFPYSNATQRATDPYPLGTLLVPFFTILPISIRSLLRISQRVTLVRSIVFALIVTPFFWTLAAICEQDYLANALLGGILAFAICWNFSRPVFIYHRLQAALKRKRGVFLLHFATSTVQVALFLLWIASGFCGVSAAYLWAAEKNEFLLIPAAIVGLALNAVFSRVILEILINEVRHRRYDWVAKPKS